MTINKQEEMATLQAQHPTFSPFTLLKLSMTCHGARLTDAALEKVQDPLYRFTKASPFDISWTGRPKDLYMPGPILLRDGSFVYINYGDPYENPYTVDYEGGLFLLKEGEEVVDVVDFVPRPNFFDKVTSRGTPMSAMADVRGQKLLLTAYQRCRLWEGGDQCGFCAFFTGGNTKAETDPEDMYETIHELLKEPGRFSEITLSGGTDFSGNPPFSVEIQRYITALQAIGRNFSDRFPCQLIAPAYPKDQVRRLYNETGLTSYAADIEVWGEELFRELCPGKEKWVGYREWIRRTLDAVEIFGEGKVSTQIVAGAELAAKNGHRDMEAALAANFEACDFFSRHGVQFLTILWRPHRAERLGYRPMLPLTYYVRLAEGVHRIRRSYGLRNTNDDYKHCGNHPDSDLERLE